MARYFPDRETFRRRAGSAQVVPVYRRLLGDRLTPVTAFSLLSADAQHAFLLESVVGGERVGRYSFIASHPRAVYSVKDGHATLTRGAQSETSETTDPLADLRSMLGQRTFAKNPDLPSFTGGLVGYAGYDLARYYEPGKLGEPPTDDRGLPDAVFGLYGELVIFDHVDKTVKVVANAHTAAGADASYDDACRRIDALVERLRGVPELPAGEIDPTAPLSPAFEERLTANLSRDQYESAVEKGREYIRAGDIFQFVPSLRMRATSKAKPFDVYRALRVVNPSPFMFYLKTPQCVLVGNSPEILCRVKDGNVESRPLAGTRRRGATAHEDETLAAELLADPKERAEHIMLVDLHRNDVGRVSRLGSVKVEDLMTVEKYSHVMHITTHVTGELDEQYDALDALRVSLPVGTVSGAPKLRAMQIIDELEPTRRGPYAGAVGYADYSGDLDTCIALRTIVWRPAAGGAGQYDVQAGAGVVADSVPSAEYQECMNKARAMLKAVEIAEAGFGPGA